VKRTSQLALIAVVGLATIAGADHSFRAAAQRSDAATLQSALMRAAEHLEDNLHSGIVAIESLAGFMQVPATQPGLDRFDTFAALLLARHQNLRALAYVDRNAVIRHFYPKRGNEAAIGLDLKRRPAAPFVATAIRERRTTVNHPTRTVQGTLAVIARTPFYRDGQLAGLVQGIFEVSKVVAGAAASPDPRVGYQLHDAAGQQFFGVEALPTDPLTATVKVGDNHWQLRVGWLAGPPGPAPALLGLLWIGGLLLLASLLVLIWRSQARESWLRAAVDEQTRALHDREARYRVIVETAQEGIWQIDAEGHTVFANQKMADMLGTTVEAMQGRTLFTFMDDEGKAIAESNLERRRQGLAELHEFKFLRRDGGSFWALLNTNPLHDEQGNYGGAFAMITDITERKRAEDSLLQIARGVSATTGESFFHSLTAHLARILDADFAFIGELIADASDRIRTVAVHAQGQQAANFEYALSGTPCQDVVGKETCTYPSEVAKQFPDDRLLTEMEVEAYVGTPLFGAAGQALGLLAVLYRRPINNDTTVASTLEIFAARAAAELERVHTEQALRDSETMLARAQEMTHLGSWTWQVDNGQVTWSDEMYRIYGISPDAEKISFERVMAAIHPDDREHVAQQVQDMLAGKEIDNYEFRILRPDGVQRDVWARSEVRRDASGSPLLVIGTVQDISGRKRVEQALRENEARLRAVVSNAPVVLFTLDPDGVIRLSEGRGLAALQLEPGEVVGRSVFEMYREYPEIIATIRRALAGEALVHNVTLGPLTFEGHYTPTFSADGRVETVIGLAIDISARRRAEEALIQSESNFRALTENANVGILVNHRGKHVFANNRLLEMLGYTADEFRATGVKELVHPQEYDKVMARFQERLTGQSGPAVYETVFMTKTGQAVPVELTAARTTWHGEPAGLVMLQDIRERLRAETQMRKLSSALEQTADSVMITNRDGAIEYVNLGFENSTGYSRAEAIGQTPRLLKSGKQGAGFYKKLWDTILAGKIFSEVFVNRRKDGSLYFEEETITPLKNAAGEITNFVATGKDVTERMQTQERLQHMAQHDALTELPNRVLFMDRLKQSLARARWHERLVAVLFVDMDRFKTINDTLGHEFGDRLLQALAERLSSSVREGDTVARFGGDEFVILLDDVGSDMDIGAVAQKILESLAPPFTIDSHSLYVTASIGISLYPNDGEDSGTLLKHADIAMYRAKDIGKNTYQFYSADMSARAFERLTLESSLRRAVERQEFRLYYQPQIDTVTGAILSVEALLRWQHPDFGLVLPAEFIPLLEETGLIIPVGEWVFHAACQQLCAWHAAGWPTLRMAVNLSPRQFQGTGLALMVERGLAAVGCDPGLIEIEITENVLLRHDATTLETLDALRALGVRLAIDDFGTGYSSLSYLRRYSIDTLKVDRSFVHDVPGDADDSALVSAIIVLAQSLKLNVVAEGVETEAQRMFLQERGCQIMQGYLFSRPLPAEDILTLLDTRRSKD